MQQSLHFSLPDAYGGLADTHGLARIEEDALVLEFSSSVLGIFQGGVRELRIPIQDLVSAELRKRFFKTLLEIRARTLRSLEGVPGAKAGILNLHVGKSHREAAEHLATALSMRIATHELRRLDAAIKAQGEDL